MILIHSTRNILSLNISLHRRPLAVNVNIVKRQPKLANHDTLRGVDIPQSKLVNSNMVVLEAAT